MTETVAEAAGEPSAEGKSDHPPVGRNTNDKGTADGENSNNLLRLWSKRWQPLIAAAALIIMFLAYFLIPNEPLMIIDADTRQLDYVAVNSVEGRVRFRTPVAVSATPGARAACMPGLFEPSVMASVNYALFKDTLVIRASGGEFLPEDRRAPKIRLTEESSLAYGPQAGCGEHEALLLPIWGPARIGAPPQPQTLAALTDSFNGLLLAGSVKVFGQSFSDHRLYPAGEFSLPAGAQLSSGAGRLESGPPWWGFAAYSGGARGDAFAAALTVSASTNSQGLSLKRLAGGPKPERIEIGFLTRLSNNPIVTGLAALVAGLLAICQVLDSIDKLKKVGGGKPNEN